MNVECKHEWISKCIEGWMPGCIHDSIFLWIKQRSEKENEKVWVNKCMNKFKNKCIIECKNIWMMNVN